MNSRRRLHNAANVPALFLIQATGDQTEPLEGRTLLSNLAITDAYLVDGSGTKTTSPILGERLEIRADYTTDSLPAAATYAICAVLPFPQPFCLRSSATLSPAQRVLTGELLILRTSIRVLEGDRLIHV